MAILKMIVDVTGKSCFKCSAKLDIHSVAKSSNGLSLIYNGDKLICNSCER